MTRAQLRVSRRLWRTRELYRLRKYRFYRDKSKRPAAEKARLQQHWLGLYRSARWQRRERDKDLAVTHVSLGGLKLIAGFEGFSSRAYKPVAAERYYTIGYGHYGPDVRPGQRISRVAGLNLLRKDVKRFESAVRKAVKVPLSQNEFNALVSLCYNIGEGAFANSDVVSALNRGNRRAAADHFLDWNKGASGPLAGLTTRRRKERSLFLK